MYVNLKGTDNTIYNRNPNTDMVDNRTSIPQENVQVQTASIAPGMGKIDFFKVGAIAGIAYLILRVAGRK